MCKPRSTLLSTDHERIVRFVETRIRLIYPDTPAKLREMLEQVYLQGALDKHRALRKAGLLQQEALH